MHVQCAIHVKFKHSLTKSLLNMCLKSFINMYNAMLILKSLDIHFSIL